MSSIGPSLWATRDAVIYLIKAGVMGLHCQAPTQRDHIILLLCFYMGQTKFKPLENQYLASIVPEARSIISILFPGTNTVIYI
jgi:hypothetical protein